MAVTILQQLADSRAVAGGTHTFSVTATGLGTLSYAWLLDNNPVGTDSPTLSFSADLPASDYGRVVVIVTDSEDSLASDIALAIKTSVSLQPFRLSLVWNYDDDNFVWREPAVEVLGDDFRVTTHPITYQVYGFVPGHGERWDDYKDGAVYASTWSDAITAQKLWSDTFSKGRSKELIQAANSSIWLANKVINEDWARKFYYVERTQIDFDDVVPEFKSNNIKQTRRFVFHMQADESGLSPGDTNDIYFTVGWSNNLMESPNWRTPVKVSLRDRNAGGGYKIDYRSSGRYMAYSFDLSYTTQLAFTGGVIDVSERAGR